MIRLLTLIGMISVSLVGRAGVSFSGYCADTIEPSCEKYSFFVEDGIKEEVVVELMDSRIFESGEYILRITVGSSSTLVVKTGRRIGTDKVYLSGSEYTFQLDDGKWTLIGTTSWIS